MPPRIAASTTPSPCCSLWRRDRVLLGRIRIEKRVSRCVGKRAHGLPAGPEDRRRLVRSNSRLRLTFFGARLPARLDSSWMDGMIEISEYVFVLKHNLVSIVGNEIYIPDRNRPLTFWVPDLPNIGLFDGDLDLHAVTRADQPGYEYRLGQSIRTIVTSPAPLTEIDVNIRSRTTPLILELSFDSNGKSKIGIRMKSIPKGVM